MVDGIGWQDVASALAALMVPVAGAVWVRVSGDLARVSAGLVEVAKIVHGHQIRLDYIEERRSDG
ncbi:hypothetical protein OD754_10715 [Rhodobacter capsulatus]|uniref:hypothetical protein n=1 Tax=Rhodobacter capsulatus TaxID=1061 RepID=UPI002876FD72|nr:hypothetical protein [Rhodobacter capsulatus]MDS0927295.1 hypothetical protein [Rhodobacter capsulatus]UYE93268.1 hypothetical protein Jorvik_19 [Rhodobacter phage Jorvik]